MMDPPTPNLHTTIILIFITILKPRPSPLSPTPQSNSSPFISAIKNHATTLNPAR